MTGRLLIYVHVEGSLIPELHLPAMDLIRLTASLQRRFPDHSVEPADLQWLRGVVAKTLPLPRPLPRRKPPPPKLRSDSAGSLALFVASHIHMPPGPPPHEYVYLVLAWLGGTMSKEVAEQAIKAAADLVGQWMRERRSKKDSVPKTAYILGPDGKVLKKVEVRPEPPARRRATRRRR